MTPPPPPLRPLLPRVPFGPGDESILDDAAINKIRDDAQMLKERLESERARLEALRQGSPPKKSGDEPPPKPISRADSFLPFLVIRSFVGDIGARPAPQASSISSPDILLTVLNPQYTKTVLGRDDMTDFLAQNTIVHGVHPANTHDVWIHVWNLGRAPAYGVRVSAWAEGKFVGGREPDLGDRASATSHLIVKVGSYRVISFKNPQEIRATAECLVDAGAGLDPSKDRHTAHAFVKLLLTA